MLSAKVILSQGGRIAIPARIRKALSMKEGDEFFIKVENQELRIFNREHAVAEAQTLMAQYNPKKVCLSEKILEDRRREN
jgi:AbrB family looped-hinge helix DNA binding protein